MKNIKLILLALIVCGCSVQKEHSTLFINSNVRNEFEQCKILKFSDTGLFTISFSGRVYFKDKTSEFVTIKCDNSSCHGAISNDNGVMLTTPKGVWNDDKFIIKTNDMLEVISSDGYQTFFSYEGSVGKSDVKCTFEKY